MSALKIAKISARPVLAPLERPITTATISIPKAPLVLIDIQTDQGIVGRSYVFTYTPLTMSPMVELIEAAGTILVGKSVHPTDRMKDLETTFRLLGRQGLIAMTIAGLDMALWDAFAKSRDMSVAEMMGSGSTPVPCYDSHGVFLAGRDEPLIEASLDLGFKAIKFKIGGGSLQKDIDTIKTIRSLIGPDIKLMVDYNQSLDVPEAVTRIKRFENEGFNLEWVEEPVPAEDFFGHRAIREQVDTAIQTGENWWMPDDAARAIQAGVSDHAMLDIMKIGGFSGWLQAAAYARMNALPVSSHIFLEASTHALANTPNAYLLEYLDIAGSILSEPYQVVDGMLSPRGLGLGMEWDEQAVQKYLI